MTAKSFQRLGFLLAGSLLAAAPAFAQADPTTLATYLRTLAGSPRDLPALLGAGRAALAAGDANAAIGFFSRASEVDPRNGLAKAGLGSTMVVLERPDEALRFFGEALALGIPETRFARDRGLAYDLKGDFRRAQRDYALALRNGPDDEVTRRYALSLGISGDRTGAAALLDPLLRRQDPAAWRARAFILAMNGDMAGARRVTSAVMPPALAQSLDPFMQKLAALSPADRAHAVNFGTMPAGPIVPARTAPPVAVAAAEPAPTTRARGRTSARASAPVAAAPVVASPVRVAERKPEPAKPAVRRRTGSDGFSIYGLQMARAEREAQERAAAARARQQAEAAQRAQAAAAPPPQPVVEQPAQQVIAAVQTPAATTLIETPFEVAPVSQPVATPPVVASVAARPALASLLSNIPTEAETTPIAVPDAAAIRAERLAEQRRLAQAKAAADAKAAAAKKAADAKLAADKKAAAEKAQADKEAAAKKLVEKQHPARTWVQVASGPNASALPFTWGKLKKQHEALAKQSPYAMPFGRTNRLLVGPLKTPAEARALVTRLSKDGLQATVFQSSAGQEIDKLAAK